MPNVRATQRPQLSNVSKNKNKKIRIQFVILPRCSVSGKKSFLATTVKPNEKVELTSAPVSVSSPTQMWINYYEATDGVALQGCSNDANTNCQDISNVGIDKTDNRWRVGKYQITPDTKNVISTQSSIYYPYW